MDSSQALGTLSGPESSAAVAACCASMEPGCAEDEVVPVGGAGGAGAWPDVCWGA